MVCILLGKLLTPLCQIYDIFGQVLLLQMAKSDNTAWARSGGRRSRL